MSSTAGFDTTNCSDHFDTNDFGERLSRLEVLLGQITVNLAALQQSIQDALLKQNTPTCQQVKPPTMILKYCNDDNPM